MRTKFKVMTRRTYEADAEHIETADDLDDLVHDKREGWRANSSKARRSKSGIRNVLQMNAYE